MLFLVCRYITDEFTERRGGRQRLQAGFDYNSIVIQTSREKVEGVLSSENTFAQMQSRFLDKLPPEVSNIAWGGLHWPAALGCNRVAQCKDRLQW